MKFNSKENRNPMTVELQKDDVEAKVQVDSLFFSSEATVPGLVNVEENLLPVVREVAEKISQAKNPRVYFIGGGASQCASIGGKYLLNRFTSVSAEATNGYQFLSQLPFSLDPDSFIFATSYSGTTPEVLEVVAQAKEKSVTTIGLTNTLETPLAKASDYVLDYQNKAVYTVPLAIFYWVAAEVMKMRYESVSVSEEIKRSLKELPNLYPSHIEGTRTLARELAEKFVSEEGFYVLGSGPLYGLAYKLALSVVIENLWIDGCPIDTGDFYHGPIEIVPPDTSAKQRMAFMHLLGTDISRKASLRAVEFCEKRNGRQVVFDAADFPQFGELFSPFALFAPTEWFIMYLSALRGHDVDERRYMGMVSAKWGEY
jgi:fructoselysine 6-phosphate deglycase